MHDIDLGQVECSTTITCTTADLGSMTARDCCIGHPDGLAYTISGSEECYVCIGRCNNYNNFIIIIKLIA